jgi:chemotaxis protein CheX
MERNAIVAAVEEATRNVFSMMVNLEVAPQEPIDHPDPEPVDGVVALLGFTGGWIGTGMLFCSDRLACRIGSAMMMAEVHDINGDVLDGIGEMANMVLGNFKEAMEAHLGALTLSVPTVVYGKNFSTRTPVQASWTIVPFLVAQERFEVRVCLKQKNSG